MSSEGRSRTVKLETVNNQEVYETQNNIKICVR